MSFNAEIQLEYSINLRFPITSKSKVVFKVKRAQKLGNRGKYTLEIDPFTFPDPHHLTSISIAVITQLCVLRLGFSCVPAFRLKVKIIPKTLQLVKVNI